MLKIVIVGLVLLLASSAVREFDQAVVKEIFEDKTGALFLFVKDFNNEQDEAAHQAFKAYDETNPGILLTVSRSDDGHNFFERLAEYVGVDVSQTPKVLYANSKLEKFKYEQDSITAQSLAAFIGKVQSGQLKPFLKSAAIPESNDQPVKVVVGKTWEQYVANSSKQVLVKFYAPWCGHCKTLAPHYDQAARRLAANENILLVKVDSTENEVPGIDVQGFPTLKLFRKDKSVEPIDFQGGRDADGIINFLKEHSEYPWVEPAEGSGVQAEEEAEEEEL